MPGFEILGKEEQEAINELFEINGCVLFAHGFEKIRNGVFRVREFEKTFSEKMNISFAQAVSSGSSALKVALKALGVKRGDEIIAPAFTFVATVEAILDIGAVPVLAEINDTLNLCPKSFENSITKKTKGVIPVHMMGAPAEMDKIMTIAKKNNLWVLEDNAQSCGGTHHGKFLGTIGDIGTFSFDTAKTITTGEGGMILTNQKSLFLLARAYHDHGHEYSTTIPRGEENALLTGFNYRMTELQATIGLIQLSKLDYILKQQRANKKLLKEILSDFPHPFRRLADEKGEIGDSLIFFMETSKIASRFAHEMKKLGYGTKNLPDAVRWHFCKHWHHMFKEYNFYDDFKNRWQKSADLIERAVAIPIMVKMSKNQIQEIGEILLNISKKF